MVSNISTGGYYNYTLEMAKQNNKAFSENMAAIQKETVQEQDRLTKEMIKLGENIDIRI